MTMNVVQSISPCLNALCGPDAFPAFFAVEHPGILEPDIYPIIGGLA